MFIRPYFRTINGTRRAYWALVESYRSGQGPRQRVVAWLGQLDESGRLGVKQAAEGKPRSPQKKLFPEPEPEPTGWPGQTWPGAEGTRCQAFNVKRHRPTSNSSSVSNPGGHRIGKIDGWPGRMVDGQLRKLAVTGAMVGSR